jgi:hypothetical protein
MKYYRLYLYNRIKSVIKENIHIKFLRMDKNNLFVKKIKNKQYGRHGRLL